MAAVTAGVCSHSLLQGSFWPRDWTQVSCIAGRFFTVWATREALCSLCIPSFYKTKKCQFDTASVVWPWRLQQEPPARAQSSSLNFLLPENHFIMFLGPALLLQLKEGLEFHPIKCVQLQLFWICLHANDTLRNWFSGWKKGTIALDFFNLCRQAFLMTIQFSLKVLIPLKKRN